MLSTTLSYDIIAAELVTQKMLNEILLLKEYLTELNECKIVNR